MKIKLTPKQTVMLIQLRQLANHPIIMKGKSAKLLGEYIRENGIQLKQ